MMRLLFDLALQISIELLGEVLAHWWRASLIAIAIAAASAYFVGTAGLLTGIPGFAAGLVVEWYLDAGGGPGPGANPGSGLGGGGG